VLHAARWKCRTQRIAKNSLSGHRRTTSSGYIFAIKACINNRKNLLNSNISPTCSHNIVNFGPLTVEICSGVWAPQRISTGFASWFCYYSDVAHRTPTWAGTLYIHFAGSCPLTEFCYVQNSLAFSYIVSVTARHSSSGRQPNFAAWYKEWNYGTFAEGATYSWLGSHHIGHRPIF